MRKVKRRNAGKWHGCIPSVVKRRLSHVTQLAVIGCNWKCFK
jgi:hypothetical protein